MIIESNTTFTLSFTGWSSPSDISPVIVTKQECNIVRHIESGIIISLYFGEDGPQLWNCVRAAINITDHLTLAFYHLRECLHIILIISFSHGYISITTHANSDQILIVFVSLHSLAEEFVKSFLIDRIVPWSHLVSTGSIFLMSSHHGFMMRCSHHNTVFVGQ